MFGFVGPDGAGKITAMRIILGVLAPDAGEVRWRGQPMTDEMRKRIGYLPEDHGQTSLKGSLLIAAWRCRRVTCCSLLDGAGPRRVMSVVMTVSSRSAPRHGPRRDRRPARRGRVRSVGGAGAGCQGRP
jgi:ABC-type Mn2+/Zn2+ transport system ATPase subunit